MKNSNIIVALILVLTCLNACKDALELPPEDYFSDGNYWQNESQVLNNMDALHSNFRGHQFMFLRLGEMRGGGFYNRDRMGVALNELNIINQDLSEISTGVSNWGGLYASILQVNLFIDKVEPMSTIDASSKGYLLGQAYAMRAYYYFHLLRTYGGVPLRLTPDVTLEKPDPVQLRLPRASEEEVLGSIKNDIKLAAENFGNQVTQSKKLWSPNALKMLKGEVYLWSARVYGNTQDLNEAKSALSSISGHTLLKDFSEVFDKKDNEEIIFAIHHQYKEAEMTPSSAFLYALPNFDGMYYKDTIDISAPTLSDPLQLAQVSSQAIQRYSYTYDLFREYDLSDQRRNATFYDFYALDRTTTPQTVTIHNTVLVKFLGDIHNNIRHFTNDWPVYREADRLLLLAEIANTEGADPSQYIQPVRDRAYNEADPTPFTNGSRDQNELAIFKERIKEFVFEGKRWYDVRRMKVAEKPLAFKTELHPHGVLNENTQKHMLLWPIERGIWTNDPTVEQTPGYTTTKP